MTKRPKRRVLDPSRMRPLSQADLDRIYGPHGLSFYSPVRPTPSSADEREDPDQSGNCTTASEGTDE